MPLLLAPFRSLGFKLALGLPGFPSNRIIVHYGPPGGGKSSLLWTIAAEYEHNGDEVLIYEPEQALDRIFVASYFDKEDTTDWKIESLKHLLKLSEKHAKENAKASDDQKTMSDFNSAIVEKRIAAIPTLIKEIKEGKTISESELGRGYSKSLLRYSSAEYRLRNVEIEHPGTLEEFEKDLLKRIEAKKNSAERRRKRLVVGIDSVNYLLPKEDIEKATSSDGRSIMTAKYLHTLLPRLLHYTKGLEITIIFIHQQAVTMRMNPYAAYDPIGDLATKGGTATKFGATSMIGVERKKKAMTVGEKEVHTGAINLPKAKLRGGSKPRLGAKFYLKEDEEKSTLDFDEPFIVDEIIEGKRYGVFKSKAKHFIPQRFLTHLENYQSEVEPALVPEDGKIPEDGLYYPTKDLEFIVESLRTSPTLEEEVLDSYEITQVV